MSWLPSQCFGLRTGSTRHPKPPSSDPKRRCRTPPQPCRHPKRSIQHPERHSHVRKESENCQKASILDTRCSILDTGCSIHFRKHSVHIRELSDRCRKCSAQFPKRPLKMTCLQVISLAPLMTKSEIDSGGCELHSNHLDGDSPPAQRRWRRHSP